jgi:hypothetical protein
MNVTTHGKLRAKHENALLQVDRPPLLDASTKMSSSVA